MASELDHWWSMIYRGINALPKICGSSLNAILMDLSFIWNLFISHCREKRQGTLTIDQSDSVTSVSVSGATQLDTDGFLWLGGSPAPPRGLPLHYYLGFTGCIESVSIEDEALNLVQNRVIHGSVEFCPLWGSAYIVTWLDRSHDYLAVAMWLL